MKGLTALMLPIKHFGLLYLAFLISGSGAHTLYTLVNLILVLNEPLTDSQEGKLYKTEEITIGTYFAFQIACKKE